MRRAEPWTIADILDFEYLLAADARGDDAAIRARDRAIFDAQIAPQLDPAAQSDRRGIFRQWLTARRAAEDGPLPGAHFANGWQTLMTGAVLAGLALGISVTAGLLHYRGSEPVNVAWFFAATVGVQWLILGAALLWWMLRRTTGWLRDFHPLRAVLAAFLWALSTGLRRLPGEQRERMRATLANVGRHREIYGSLASWPVLVVTQLFGVCFNLGILATLLLQIALSDVAFGWQSTLRTSPEEAFQLVRTVATPWSLLPNAHPSFDQVVASRFAYSAGIAPLSQTAMTSWWPFLSYAVGVYGLLVRVVLLALSLAALRRSLRVIPFDHHGCNALLRRLSGPVVQAQADRPALAIPPAATATSARVAGTCLVLLAEGMTVEEAACAQYLGDHFGWRTGGFLAVQIDHPSGNVAVLEQLAATAPGLVGIVVGMPARRAPIKAIALFLRKIVATSGGREVVVLLFGQGPGETPGPVTAAEFAHWQNFNAIHGLHLGFEKWSPQ